MGRLADSESARPLPQRLQALADWLEASGVDLEALVDVGRLERLEGGSWQTAIKVSDGDGDRIEVVDQHRVGWRVSPAWETGPAWPPVQPGPEFNIAPAVSNQHHESGHYTAACLPDIQAPFHDEAALDVALQIVAAVDPDVIVMHGDNLDLAEMSRFRQHPSFAAGAQLAVDRMTLLCAELRACAPAAEIVWLEGNHEARLSHLILDNAAAAYGLRPGALPDEDPARPALDIASLCRLDESDVRYLGGYPANTYWLTESCRVVHGHFTGVNAARRYLEDGVSTIYGHTHHRDWRERVLADGRLIHAVSAGCLCSVDGSVPGAMAGYDWGGPLRQPVNWQQGIALVHYSDDGVTPEMVPIVDGTAIFRGESITAA